MFRYHYRYYANDYMVTKVWIVSGNLHRKTHFNLSGWSKQQFALSKNNYNLVQLLIRITQKFPTNQWNNIAKSREGSNKWKSTFVYLDTPHDTALRQRHPLMNDDFDFPVHNKYFISYFSVMSHDMSPRKLWFAIKNILLKQLNFCLLINEKIIVN